MSTTRTLDYLAAKTAFNLVGNAKKENRPRDIENLINKSLGVLQAQGVYALYLFLYSQAKERNPATLMLFYLWNELTDGEVPIPTPSDIHTVPLQHPDCILCNPGEWQNIQNRSYRSEEDAQDRQMKIIFFLEKCIRLEGQESLWGTDAASLEDLHYEVHSRNNRWFVRPNRNDLHNRFTQLPSTREILLGRIRDLTAHLDTLLLVRDLYEQTLIYARYHAKALSNTAQREKTP